MSRIPHLFPEGAQLGRDNTVLNARARSHVVENYMGPLSIKTVLNGEATWKVQGRELVVHRSSFLIIGAGERYSMNINALRPVETCCAFFAPGFVERVALDATSPLEQSLDQPDRQSRPLPYLSALHNNREHSLVSRLQSLAPRCRGAIAPSGFEEDFLTLAGDLLGLYSQVREEAARLPAIRESTRQELYRRLLLGREYMHSHVSGPVSLEDIARAACLSPFHFHRGFAQAFQQTPHTYLTALRMERARQLLEAGSSALNACIEVGFSSPSAFARLFRSRYGVPPSALRRPSS